MSGQQKFKTGCTTITLKESPWSVTRTISIYVQRVGKKLAVFNDPDCLGSELNPVSLEVYRGQSTGLYFYIAESSEGKPQFPDPDKNHLPIAWENNASCPATVLYGKMKKDRSAFSMSDLYTHTSEIDHGFDIIVDPGDGGPLLKTSLFNKIDPTIAEKGEDPP